METKVFTLDITLIVTHDMMSQTGTYTYSDTNEESTPEVFDLSGQLMLNKKFLVADYENTLRNLSLSNGMYVTAIIHSTGAADLRKYLRMY